ncbi:MAG: NAD(+)/NADH kinase, partial [Candidatus Thorarchaeota archaeon]
IEMSPKILTERRAVGLVCKPDRPGAEKMAGILVDFLKSRDINVTIDEGSCQVEDNGIEHVSIDKMEVDFVITIGGDGTILYTLSQLKDRETPLFCVNRGSVGFMTESSTTTALSTLKKILDGECIIESNINLSSGVGDRIFEDALNEVYVVSRIPGRLLTFQVKIDGIGVDFGRADGAMLATPTGSTAYALAAGGSVLTPNVHGLIFVPVCPPRFELKSMVLPDNSVLELELVKPGADGLAIIDGQVSYPVEASETVWVKKAKGVSRFIRLSDNYYDRLNTRLIPRTQ